MKHLEAIVSGFAQFGLECIGNLAFIFGGRYHAAYLPRVLIVMACTAWGWLKAILGGLIPRIIPHDGVFMCVYVCVCVCVCVYIYI